MCTDNIKTLILILTILIVAGNISYGEAKFVEAKGVLIGGPRTLMSGDITVRVRPVGCMSIRFEETDQGELAGSGSLGWTMLSPDKTIDIPNVSCSFGEDWLGYIHLDKETKTAFKYEAIKFGGKHAKGTYSFELTDGISLTLHKEKEVLQGYFEGEASPSSGVGILSKKETIKTKVQDTKEKAKKVKTEAQDTKGETEETRAAIKDTKNSGQKNGNTEESDQEKGKEEGNDRGKKQSSDKEDTGKEEQPNIIAPSSLRKGDKLPLYREKGNGLVILKIATDR